MRDPRESHWAFSASLWGDPPDANEAFWRVQARIQELKRSVRVLSLIEDDSVYRLPHESVFSRGFSHPRLWEQYADNHKGVCLLLDRQELVQEATRVAAPLGRLEHRSVTYRDGEIGFEASGVDLNRILKQSVNEVLEAHLDEHVDELFFTKLNDWASEVEYRFLLRWDSEEELFVDVAKVLRGVIAGHAVADEYAPAFQALCEPPGIKLARIWWKNGRPVPVPFGSSS
jgi:Protein of unknown function (DUF2971)